MTPEEVEKGFWDYFRQTGWFEISRNIPGISKSAKEAYFEAHSRQERRIERLKEGIKNIPWNEYGDALREGCDTNGAWNCFCDETNKHIQKLLEAEG